MSADLQLRFTIDSAGVISDLRMVDLKILTAERQAAAASAEHAGRRHRALRMSRGPLWDAICWLIGHRQQFRETFRGSTWCPRCWRIVAVRA